MDVTSDALALLEHRSGRQHLTRPPQLERAADEQGKEEPQTQHIAGVEVPRVQRRNQEVVQPRERAQRRRDGEPARELVRTALGAADEPRRGDAEEHITVSWAARTVGRPTTRVWRRLSDERS